MTTTPWHTSSYSGSSDRCVEVAEAPTQARMRDSQHPHRGQLEFPAAEWRAFLIAAQRGHL